MRAGLATNRNICSIIDFSVFKIALNENHSEQSKLKDLADCDPGFFQTDKGNFSDTTEYKLQKLGQLADPPHTPKSQKIACFFHLHKHFEFLLVFLFK